MIELWGISKGDKHHGEINENEEGVPIGILTKGDRESHKDLKVREWARRMPGGRTIQAKGPGCAKVLRWEGA